MSEREFRSFADPDTEFVLLRSETPVSVDGFAQGEYTGEVKCPHCERTSAAPEYIAHPEDCPNHGVTSRWYEELHAVVDDE